MIYKSAEIEEVIETLKEMGRVDCDYHGNVKINQQLINKVVDIMDDMNHALNMYGEISSYFYANGMLPTDPEDCARFWNRPQDKDNTRVWEE